ncbi:MAG: sialate O-acetylesterase [Luteolibacter sp.]
MKIPSKLWAGVCLAGILFTNLASAEDGADKRQHLFILSGQSNMARLDPGVSFTPAVEKAFGKDKVTVVKGAKGGMPIKEWYKDWKPAEGKVRGKNGALYDKLIAVMTPAIEGKEFDSVTFVWMQGERDSKDGWDKVYKDSLLGLVQQLRDDLGRQDINVVIGRLSDAKLGTPGWDSIRQIQKEVCEANPRWKWVNTDDLDRPKNDVHYTEAGYRMLGERFAEKAILLINGQ